MVQHGTHSGADVSPTLFSLAFQHFLLGGKVCYSLRVLIPQCQLPNACWFPSSTSFWDRVIFLTGAESFLLPKDLGYQYSKDQHVLPVPWDTPLQSFICPVRAALPRLAAASCRQLVLSRDLGWVQAHLHARLTAVGLSSAEIPVWLPCLSWATGECKPCSQEEVRHCTAAFPPPSYVPKCSLGGDDRKGRKCGDMALREPWGCSCRAKAISNQPHQRVLPLQWRAGGLLHIVKLNYMSVTSNATPASILQQKLGPCPYPGLGSGEAGPLVALPLFKLSPSKLQHVRCAKNCLFFP